MLTMSCRWYILLLPSSSILTTSSSERSEKPALILVPGAFHRTGVYGEVKSRLSDVGYDHVDMVELPSLGYDVVEAERASDADVVTGLLKGRLKDDQDDAIQVGNSCGATVIMEAVKDFENRSPNSAPTIKGQGRILGLIMVCTPSTRSFDCPTD